MSLTELYKNLKSTGYDVAYHHFNKEPSFPFVAYYENERSYLKGDNVNYHESKNITVELYTESANDTQLDKIKEALKDIAFELEPFIYIKEEQMYMSIFTFGL